MNGTMIQFNFAVNEFLPLLFYKPTWLQHVNRSPILLLALCICAVCQGSIVNGFISTSISSLEKRFNLSSTQSGHKGRVIATGMVLVAIGSFLLILPHFLAGNYTVGEEHHNVCLNDNYNNNNNHKQQHSFSTADDVNSCSADDHTNSVNSIWFYILLSSQLFIGIGAAPLFTLGISYLDENVSQNSVTLYLGIYMAMSTVGPAIGFIVGGQLLKIWGDIGKTDYRDLNISGTTDPRWYGAWWIGFAVAAILSILSAIPLFGFPKELPGIIVVPMGLFGSLFGAYMAKRTLRFQPTILLAIIFNIFALCLSFVFFDQCEQRPFAGVTYSYTGVVSFDTRDVAIGLTWLFMRIFVCGIHIGSIPGAIIFGFAIDRTCILWKEECGVQQSCLRYDSYGLSRSMVMFGINFHFKFRSKTITSRIMIMNPST
ncbi:unnamed protein product [Anisakis simplex]|uniref:Solute carrier organic anion transporter family member n=1 Tax=Anisakis simplex TaxID=6269 RepID=A0A0M3JTP9_ANISI|nr:unnamed protein product [Anisakis simplex]